MNNCCTNCFSEIEINQFIETEEIKGECDYCNSSDVYICDVDSVGQFIIEGIERHYEDAANHVGYCSADGGYQLPTYTISEIILYQEGIFDIFGEGLVDPESLLRDLVTDDGTPYVRIDPYGPPSGEPDEIRYWENFCTTVKTKKRFTAFLSSDDEDKFDYGLPNNFLFHLANNYIPNLIHVVPSGTKIYRARINNENKDLSHKDLTSPAPENSRNGRMSPIGISFFYGGMSPKVCIHEVRPDIAEHIEIAEFEVVKELLILNLAIEFEAPKSIFNIDYNFSYEEHFKPVLEHFSRDISKPIRKSDNEIEYIPTQVFTEFIKTINFKDHYYWPDNNGKERDVFVDGIQFHSSIMNGGLNIVLFR
ncbi:HEPN-associated N-terminal domain-containing protein, partial [Thermodesulfobacteriota bacterium]